MVIGGQAVLLYGEPRLTRDIDITLGIGPQNLPKIKKIVRELKLAPLVKNADKFVTETLVFPVENKKEGIRVDFIFSYSDFEKEAIKRGRKIKIGKTPVTFASPEDIIIYKIIAGRPKDLDDVKNILLKTKIDKKYIYKSLKIFSESLDNNFTEDFELLLINNIS